MEGGAPATPIAGSQELAPPLIFMKFLLINFLHDGFGRTIAGSALTESGNYFIKGRNHFVPKCGLIGQAQDFLRDSIWLGTMLYELRNDLLIREHVRHSKIINLYDGAPCEVGRPRNLID